MTGEYSDLAPLERRHEVGGFRCASEAQTEWLLQQGPNNRRAGTAAKVYVVAEAEASHVVVAYFAWCKSGVASDTLPSRFVQGAGGYSMQPFLLLARLGVHSDHEGRGLGSQMLGHVIVETYKYSQKIGCRGLLIHAENDGAVAYYRSKIADFSSVTGNEQHLLLLAKDKGMSPIIALGLPVSCPHDAAERHVRRAGCSVECGVPPPFQMWSLP